MKNTSIRVLLAGESWVSSSTHYKGWDFFSSTVYETGIENLQQALEGSSIELVHLPGHEAPLKFPVSLEELSEYDAVILSDIGANSLLLHPDTWVKGKPAVNRLELLKSWVDGGGALGMCGGYYSFAGIYGASKYYRTPVEEILPVTIFTFDDRVEAPQGVVPEILIEDHPIVKGIKQPWPVLLGFNELTVKEQATLVAKAGNHPLLAVMRYGKGRTFAWASDIGPHWCPETFTSWEGYSLLWKQALEWLADKS